MEDLDVLRRDHDAFAPHRRLPHRLARGAFLIAHGALLIAHGVLLIATGLRLIPEHLLAVAHGLFLCTLRLLLRALRLLLSTLRFALRVLLGTLRFALRLFLSTLRIALSMLGLALCLALGTLGFTLRVALGTSGFALGFALGFGSGLLVVLVTGARERWTSEQGGADQEANNKTTHDPSASLDTRTAGSMDNKSCCDILRREAIPFVGRAREISGSRNTKTFLAICGDNFAIVRNSRSTSIGIRSPPRSYDPRWIFSRTRWRSRVPR